MTVSDLAPSNSWATSTMISWIVRARRKKRLSAKNSLATSTILLMAFGSLGRTLVTKKLHRSFTLRGAMEPPPNQLKTTD